MRFFVCLIALILLPVLTGVHAWLFERRHQPALEAAALAILDREGIRGASADVRYLDLRVSGDAPSLSALHRATEALDRLGPTRLVQNHLTILSGLHGQLAEGATLRLSGWLPDPASVNQVRERLAALRPDLKIDTSALEASASVRWPEGLDQPLADHGPLLKPILDKLYVEPELTIRTTESGLTITGALPSPDLRDSITNIIRGAAHPRPVDASGILVSRHVRSAAFTDTGSLAPFLRGFFSTPQPGDFSISHSKGPSLTAAATASLETEWLALLRPVTGGAKVELNLTRYPSIYHFPSYRPATDLPAGTLETLRQTLSEFFISFTPTSSQLPDAAKSRLAGLTSTLLTAGPALRLVIGGHPAPDGEPTPQRQLAVARAEEVRSFLVEQGVPAAELDAIAFDPVPPNSPAAPLRERTVEILIK